MKIKSLLNLLKIKTKEIIKVPFNKLTMNKDAYLLFKNGQQLLKGKKIDEAIKVLEKGSKLYPNIYQFHAKIVDISSRSKDWKLSIKHWEEIYRLKEGKLKAQAYYRFGRALRFNKQIGRAEKILTKGLNFFPKDKKIIQELADVLVSGKKWKKAVKLWDRLFETKKSNLPIKAYTRSSITYRKTGFYNKSEWVLQEGIKQSPNNTAILKEYAELAIDQKDWKVAIQRLEDISEIYKNNIPMNIGLKLSIINQIVGNNSRANNLFREVLEAYPEQIKEDRIGYRKIVLFDNGESRIEYYKNLRETDTVIVTFDSIFMQWDGPPFSFKLLRRQNVDIVAVRKRRKRTYQQDLSLDDFYNAVNKLVGNYNQKIAYGFSLGGYTSLYYGASINCRILSLAPRLSIHPTYGRPNAIRKFDFNHKLSHPYNPRISPIIVYDPKNKMDRTYIENGLLQSYPNAQLIEIPYGGHEIAPHLLKMGVLKEFILAVIQGNFPKYEKKLRYKSHIYYRELGKACLLRNKLKWGIDLVDKSLSLSPTDRHGIRLKVDILKESNQHERAIEYLQKTIRFMPENLNVRILLIDIYIETKNLIAAETELNTAIGKLGKSSKLIKREKIIKKGKKGKL